MRGKDPQIPSNTPDGKAPHTETDASKIAPQPNAEPVETPSILLDAKRYLKSFKNHNPDNKAVAIVKDRTGFDITKSEKMRKLLQYSAMGLFLAASAVFFAPILLGMIGVSVSGLAIALMWGTSGVLGIAGSRQALESVNEQFKQQQAVTEASVVQNEEFIKIKTMRANLPQQPQQTTPETSFAASIDKKPDALQAIIAAGKNPERSQNGVVLGQN